MTTRHRLAKRCALLEQAVRELRRPFEFAQHRRDEQERVMLQLLTAFPEKRREELVALIESERWPGSGLASLVNLIEQGYWQPVPLPPAVADIFLAEPDVRPDAHCESCRAVLPYRMGIWENTETGKSWQAPLCYFRRCPCGGTIIGPGGRPVDIRSWLPERVVPPWTFVDERVQWRQERERTRARHDNGGS